MLSIYLVPVILRPIDFAFNAKEYVCGFISYLLLLPMYSNLMQIYSMCNLHDLSWGNRPSGPADGAEALAENAKKQVELKNNYMVFRVNFLTFWIIMNTVYALVVEDYAQYSSSNFGEDIVVNTGTIGFLEVFAMYLASLVIYKVFFAAQHILKFKFLNNFSKQYKMPRFDLHEEVKRLRAETQDWNRSLDEGEEEQENFNADVTILDNMDDADMTQDGLLVS